MSYYNTYGVMRMESFAEVKKWYEKVTPIRGNADKVKPLGNRRYHFAANITMPDADTVDLNYCGAPLVRWKPDNTFTVFSTKHANAYGPDNMTPYLPRGCFFSWNSGRMFINLPGNKTYLMDLNQGMRFQMVEGKIFMLNKPVAYSYRIKRAPLAKVMKEYQPFLDWLQVVLAVSHPMNNDELTMPYSLFVEQAGVKHKEYYNTLVMNASKETENRRMRIYSENNQWDNLPFSKRGNGSAAKGFHKPTSELLHEWVVDTSAVNWAQAMYVIAKQAAESRYSYRHSPAYIRTLKVDHAKDYLRDLAIFLNRDEVIEKMRLEDGEAPSKRNTNFFTEISFVL